MEKRQENEVKATVAPGIDDQEELAESASNKDLENGNFTEVTRLTDQVTPS
ncbi:hypothetical protein [Calidifontibacillus oryziterrae]|uniref:hypothetical protein n=1 Tax=Calidifontibacillus oryziterrae TaxID=1191699 RepID=UPI0002EA6A34|nr:hypothetical protein [Calidifontibacillus oryziterrae]